MTWSRPTDRRVRLEDYFIDKYEVSNQEYKEFINAGGYVKREYWTHAVHRKTDAVSWDDAHADAGRSHGIAWSARWSNQNSLRARPTIRLPMSPGTRPTRTPRSAGSGWPRSSSGRKPPGMAFRPPAGVDLDAMGHVLSGRPAQGARELRHGARWPTTSAAVRDERVRRLQHGWQRRRVDGERQFRWLSGDRRRLGRPDLHVLAVRRPARFFQFREARVSLRARGATDRAGDQGGAWIELEQEVPEFKPRLRQVSSRKLASAYQLRQDVARRQNRADHRDALNGSARRLRSTAPAAGVRLRTSTCPIMSARPLQVIHFAAGRRRGRQGFDRCPMRWTTAWPRSSEAGRAAFGVVLEGYVERLRPAGFVLPDPAVPSSSRKSIVEPHHGLASRPRLPRDAGPRSI